MGYPELLAYIFAFSGAGLWLALSLIKWRSK